LGITEPPEYRIISRYINTLGWMTQLLATVFGELGISQYLDAFLDQGFDTWETILDITESDLDALGVKLGHRRKLQRRIANSRGIAPDASLVSPTQPTVEEQRAQDQQRADVPKLDHRDAGVVVVTKRKYRRHPKPDENAPERPPSAYVLFSNSELHHKNDLTIAESLTLNFVLRDARGAEGPQFVLYRNSKTCWRKLAESERGGKRAI